MKKQKSISPTGTITITKKEERYPFSSEKLMDHGFLIIFLNMALGLLPITIWGNRMKYFKCSISQLYTTLFCISFIILSLIFVPVVFFPKSNAPHSMTNLVILVAMGMVHVLGYIGLLIRGHFIARKIPLVWLRLSKLIQVAILDVYGPKCYLFGEVGKFARRATREYFLMIFTTTGSTLMFSYEYTSAFETSVDYYKLNQYVFNHEEFHWLIQVQYWSYHLGYFIWQLCSSSHVLVTMLLCYVIKVITISLKSVNQQIFEFSRKISTQVGKGQGANCLGTSPPIQFDSPQNNLLFDLEHAKERFDNMTNVILITEEITQEISSVWGVSLIIESIILIAAGTANTFHFLFDEEQSADELNGIMKFHLPDVDEWIGVFVTITTHFFFLFKLTSMVTLMIAEGNKSLHLLKQTNHLAMPKSLREKITVLKQDLASSNISLSASNFFQINKFLITSITSQVATYVIVLLQFAQTEKTNGNREKLTILPTN